MLQEAETWMKRVVLLILVVLLVVDLGENGCLGKAHVCNSRLCRKLFLHYSLG
jgi:hypothetical protein